VRSIPFYRLPDGVVLEQVEDPVPVPPHTDVEVVHFGPLNTDFPVQECGMFSGTFYYKARGSGVFLNTGRTLVAYNKVHALQQLGVPEAKMLEIAGKSFTAFVRRDANRIEARTGVDRGVAVAQALAGVVQDMVDGQALREWRGTLQFYGLGSAGDSYLVLQAMAKGYDTIQLLSEAQSPPQPDAPRANVGFEIIHLRFPDYSQRLLKFPDAAL
jgi:hypothetical protein